MNFVAENRLAFAVADLNPVSPGHALVIPRRHIVSLFEVSDDELFALFELVKEVRRQRNDSLRPDGFNVGVNDGAAAGQTVMHLHIHVIPRYPGDCRDPRGGIRWINPQLADYWSR